MLKIGDFAQLGHISVRMLRHYDKIGLLAPDYVDPNSGYRYYTEEQLVGLHRIQEFSALGFHLSDIKSLVQMGTVDDIHSALWHQQQRILADIREQQQKILTLQHRMQQIECNGHVSPINFVVRYDDQHTVAQVQSPLVRDQEIMEQFRLIADAIQANNITIKKAIGIKYGTYFDTEDFGWAFQFSDMNFTHFQVNETLTLDILNLSPQLLATAVIQGAFWQSVPTNNGFYDWANYHGYELAGPVREIYFRVIEDDINHPHNLMEVQFPIRKRSN